MVQRPIFLPCYNNLKDYPKQRVKVNLSNFLEAFKGAIGSGSFITHKALIAFHQAFKGFLYAFGEI